MTPIYLYLFIFYGYNDATILLYPIFRIIKMKNENIRLANILYIIQYNIITRIIVLNNLQWVTIMAHSKLNN